MAHSDDAFATILLVGSVSPDLQEPVRPLEAREYYALRAMARERKLKGLGVLLGRDVSAVRSMLGVDEERAYRVCVLLSRAMPFSYAIERCVAAGVEVTTVDERAYPQVLRERLGDEAPPVLYHCGNLSLLDEPSLAITGTTCEGDADAVAREVVKRAGACGLVALTGGEPGVSMSAIDESMRRRGRHIAVLAEGIAGRAYEPELSELLASGGALALSATHPDAAYTPERAAQRNPLVYALAFAAAVICCPRCEGPVFSGAYRALRSSLCERMYALDDERLPGNRRLITRGAKPFTTADDLPVEHLPQIWRDAHAKQISMFDI